MQYIIPAHSSSRAALLVHVTLKVLIARCLLHLVLGCTHFSATKVTSCTHFCPSPCFVYHDRQKAAEEEAARLAAAGAGKGKGGAAPAIGGVGLARAAGVAGLEIEEAADDERHLRKVKRETKLLDC